MTLTTKTMIENPASPQAEDSASGFRVPNIIAINQTNFLITL